MIAAIDYETFYSKDYSITDLGNYAYTHHPEFDPYMLTCATDAGDLWCGDPLDFDYEAVNGATWIMANAGFDLTVTERFLEQHKSAFDASPSAVYDVLDLARYLGYPGNLAGAAEAMLGKKLDKGTRDKAKGRHWKDMTPEFQKEMSTYALRDAQMTLEIWLKYGHLWPEHERELSRITREMCAKGVPVDIKGIDHDILNLRNLLAVQRSKIPWKIEEDGKGALSKKSMAIECRKVNIEPPKSMAKTSEEFEAWLKQHGDKVPFAQAMGRYRSINTQLKRIQAMKIRSIEGDTKGEGWMPYGLKYFGGHTGRDSGDGGFNSQNPAKEILFEKEMRDYLGIPEGANPDIDYGIDIRGKIMAPGDKFLAVVDLSAIEPCCLAVLSEDLELVQLLSDGMDPYEAQARIDGEYDGAAPLKDVDKPLRQYNKVKVLGCGYGAGAEKVQSIAKTQVGLILTLEQTQELVTKFRSRKFIPDFWDKLEEAMRSTSPNDFTMGLPSGREMIYRDVKNYGSLSAVIPRKGLMMRIKTWGGSLTENLVQAAARDVFMDRILALESAGIHSVLRVHDEAVAVFDNEKKAKEGLQAMIETFSKPPAWWTTLPVRADGHICKRYHKG